MEAVNVAEGDAATPPRPTDTHRVHAAVGAGQVQVDQTVGLRQKQIHILPTERDKLGNTERDGGCVGVRGALTEASSPDRTPGFLLRSRCSRELE